MAKNPDTVTVRVPATSANLGCGFDSLGLAVTLYDEYIFRQGNQVHVNVSGEALGDVPIGSDNLAIVAARRVAARVGSPFIHTQIDHISTIPISRGMGASGAAVVAGLSAANYLFGNRLSIKELLQLGIEIEGHPDNILPAFVGGLVVLSTKNDEVEWVRLECPSSLQIALAVPCLQITTNEARKVLPESVPFADAIHNISRAALFVAAIQNNRMDLLATGMEDRIHQPYRRALHPTMDKMIEAALAAGAAGAALSGSGSTVIAFCEANAHATAESMRLSCETTGIDCRGYVCSPALDGAQISST
jgi:homoserine kinase